jgi:hypothetical protein
MGKRTKEVATRRLAIWGFAMAAISFPLSVFISSIEIYDRLAFRPRLEIEATYIWNFTPSDSLPALLAGCRINNPSDKKFAVKRYFLYGRTRKGGKEFEVASVPASFSKYMEMNLIDLPRLIEPATQIDMDFQVARDKWLKGVNLNEIGICIEFVTDHGNFRSNWIYGVSQNPLEYLRSIPQAILDSMTSGKQRF